MESRVDRQQAAIRKQCRRDQVCIDPAGTASPKLAPFHQLQCFLVSSLQRVRKFCQVCENLATLSQISARKLTQDERMHQTHTVLEKFSEAGMTFAKVLDPDGGVGQHRHNVAARRRGIGSSCGWLPPRAARRFAASRAISASSPACTSAVFSSMPVSRLARSIRTSSMISVVLICISMH
jgi:hypothetical protein